MDKKIRVEVSGVEINNILRGFISNDDQIDNAFVALYSHFYQSFFSDPYECISLLEHKFFPDFKLTLIEFYKRNPITSHMQSNIITNFTGIWQTYREKRCFEDAQKVWEIILDVISEIELIFEKRIHKGSIYYFWCGTALEAGEIDNCFFLMHAAYQEDLLSNDPNSPAYKFVSLDFRDQQQHFLPHVQTMGKYVKGFLARYNHETGSTYTIEEFQNDFLSKHTKPDSVFLFTHTIARLISRKNICDQATKNPFTGLININILFDLALVIDSSIYAKRDDDWRLSKLLDELNSTAGLSFTEARRKEIQNTANDLEQVEQLIDSLLSRSYICSDNGSVLPALESDMAISLIIRNFAAHNVISFNIFWDRFDDIIRSLLCTLFLVAEVYYP